MADIGTLLNWIATNASTILDDDRNRIMGVGVGSKEGGPLSAGGELCVTGFVEQKQTEARLSEDRVRTFETAVASAAGVAVSELQIALDVVEVGDRFAAHPGLRVGLSQRGVHGGKPPKLDLQKRFEALRIGIGITNPMHGYPNYLGVGTLGFFVSDDEGRIYLVSNNHVIAEENAANSGDTIVQPGTLDLTATELGLMNTVSNLQSTLGIAELSAWKDINFHNGAGILFNEVDCAVAELIDNGRNLDEVARVGLGGRLAGTAGLPSIDPNTGEFLGSSRVYKAGRTTGWTEGDITNLAVAADVTYTNGKARFVGQIAIAPTADNDGPFSDRGDSGSAILNDRHELIALLFAGGPQRTLANPIDRVLSLLEAELGRGPLAVLT